MEKQTLGRITPKKVPAHEAKPGTPGPVDEDAPKAEGVWKFFAAAGILLLLMVGFYWYTNHQRTVESTKNNYNGYDFTQAAGGIWVVRIQVGNQPYDIPFYYHPKDTLNVLIDPTATVPLINGNPSQVYISIDPDAGPKPVIAAVEISRITGSKYHILNYETHGVLSRPANDTKVDLPVKTCADATPDNVVIQFIQGKSDVIIRSDKYPSCILLQYSDANESIRVADRFTYMLLQIMH